MSYYHVPSIVVDVLYLIDLICDCRFYGYIDSNNVPVHDQQKIWNRMKKKKTRLLIKFLLCFPFYLFTDRLFCIKLLSGIHLWTMYLFIKKLAIYVVFSYLS